MFQRFALFFAVIAAIAMFSSGCDEDSLTTPVTCSPDCVGKVCGSDGCGGTCGTCQAEQACNAGGTACDETLSPEIAPRIPAGAWSQLLKDDPVHPRLIGPKEHLKNLSAERKSLYDEIKKEINSANVAFSNHIVWAGIQYAVEKAETGLYSINDYIAEADKYIAEYLAEGPKNEHVKSWLKLEHVARTFDFFYDRISPEKRKAMIDYANGQLGYYKTDELGLSSVANIGSKIRSYLWVAYATWGENPKAKIFRDYALINLYEGKLVPVLNQIGQGGGLPDGGSYNRDGMAALVEALELARRIEGYDGFAKAPKFFYQRLAYELLQPYPGLIPLGKYFLEAYGEEGDGAYGTNDAPRISRSMIAQYFRGSTLAGYIASKARGASYAPVKVYDFLWVEDPEGPLDITTFPLAHLASGAGKIYARGDWGEDATKLRFECGPYYSNHQHFEAGNFEIFRRDLLATESGVYDWYSNHSVNWYIRTIAHNSMLIYMPGEEWGQMRDVGEYKNTYLNDGGQESKYHAADNDLPEWLANEEKYQSGKLRSYLNQNEFMYAMCDGTKAYNPKKLKNWTREMLFLRPHTIVILDRVDNQNTPYEKKWLLHSKYEPILNNNEYVVQGTGHKLYVKTLLPVSTAEKIHGYVYGGKTVNPPTKGVGENLWRIEVKPKQNKLSEIFLHVISTEKKPEANAVMNGNDVELTVDGVKIKFSAAGESAVTIGGQSYTLEKEIQAGIYEK